jgi:hypothetical protein
MLNITNTCLYQACTNITTYHHKICVSTKYQPVPCINHQPVPSTMHTMHQTCINHVHQTACTNTCTSTHVPHHHVPYMCNHVHQHHTIYHKISSMKCLNHMPRICAKCVPSIYQDHQQVPLSMYQYQ